MSCWLYVLALSPAQAQTPANTSLPPAGFGTLHQADVAIIIRTPDIRISLLPLDERVTRLLAPDAYAALHGLLVDRRDEIAATVPGRRPDGLHAFLVTVYGATDDARFDPEQITIASRNRYFRPLVVLPISPRWSEHQIDRSATVSALFVFDRDLDPLHPMILEYHGTRVATWETTLRRLEIERSRVEARARGASHHPTPPEIPWSYIL